MYSPAQSTPAKDRECSYLVQATAPVPLLAPGGNPSGRPGRRQQAQLAWEHTQAAETPSCLTSLSLSFNTCMMGTVALLTRGTSRDLRTQMHLVCAPKHPFPQVFLSLERSGAVLAFRLEEGRQRPWCPAAIPRGWLAQGTGVPASWAFQIVGEFFPRKLEAEEALLPF